MRKHGSGRMVKILLPFVMLVQLGGCDLTNFNETLQTVFLGLTAAGSVAILQNI